MRRSYLDYAMSVIVSRALPDVRDGLKPVHRRILYSMQTNGNLWNRGYRKSARIVGDVIGKYHPHGELAIYDAMVRMAQDFAMRLPLIDGQGNFGSMDGDPPAAYRYTEARLARVADSLLDDLDNDTVDFQPNYDEVETEPKVLPAGFPNLLVNGAQGIAVGMATNIPPHNLGEVIDACCAYLDNPAITIAELMEHVPAPDFPTGGIIIGRAGTNAAYQTGRGAIVLRAKHHIEEIHGRDAIVFTEMPYQVNVESLQKRIAELYREQPHIQAGLLFAVASIDEIIALIRAAPDPAAARAGLIGRRWPAGDVGPLLVLVGEEGRGLGADGTYQLSDEQARAILDLRLQRLTGLEREKISDELRELVDEIAAHLEILRSRVRLIEVLRGEILAIKAQFANPRRTTI